MDESLIIEIPIELTESSMFFFKKKTNNIRYKYLIFHCRWSLDETLDETKYIYYR